LATERASLHRDDGNAPDIDGIPSAVDRADAAQGEVLVVRAFLGPRPSPATRSIEVVVFVFHRDVLT
jgi:hypothetical protein